MYSTRGSNLALSSDQVRRIAPSVFAQHPSETRSSEYSFIPTNKIIEKMVGSGYQVYGAMQSRTRVKENEGFQKHMVILRHDADMRSQTGDCPEVLLINSHNGGGAFRMMSGIVRFACSNGLIIMDNKQDDLRVSHREEGAMSHVLLNMYELRKKAQDHASVIAKWRTIDMLKMDVNKKLKWQRELFGTRWGDRSEYRAMRNLNTVFWPRRPADTQTDLYTMMNVAQEHIIRGGFHMYNRETNKAREVSEVKAIDTRAQINREIWRITDEFAKEFV